MATRDTQVAVEVLDQPSDQKVRATQTAVEVVTLPDDAVVRVTSVVVEVLRSRGTGWAGRTTVIWAGFDG